ncbi:MAG: PQQ-binding-like beta-propeller repeat protein [Vicinamibacterales bacterium]|nr:PQQ-binding-like beta-propeller repeat protein [Vicinamibacterales bacterium]
MRLARTTISCSVQITGAIRCGIVALVGSLTLLAAGGAWAQERRAPSRLLPLETLWTTPLPAPPSAAPVDEADHVFVPLRDGQVAAVNVADGEVVWQMPHGEVGQPAVGDALLFVATSDELRALDTATGLTRWSFPLEAPLSAPLVWNSGWLVAALDTQTLLALRAATGETIWRRDMNGGIHVTPSLAGNRMYVSLDNGGIVALALMSGDPLWEQRLNGAPAEILPLDDLFVGAADNHFYCLSELDGTIKWRMRTGGDVVGLPAVDEKRVYFTSLDNMLRALNRTNGVQQWRQTLTARPTAGPSQVGDLLVLGGLSQDLRFFDPVDGVSYGNISAPSELAFPPTSISTPADGPLLITVTGDGRLRALRRATAPEQLDLAALTLPTAMTDTDIDDANPVGGGTTDTTTATPAVPAAVDTQTGALPTERQTVGGEYAIQVAALSNGATASALLGRLVEQGYAAYVVEPRPGEEPALYRVRIGDFPNRPAAEAIGRQVEDDQDVEWFVVSLP